MSTCYTVIKGDLMGVILGFNPPAIYRFFLKSEGKEVERKKIKGMLVDFVNGGVVRNKKFLGGW